MKVDAVIAYENLREIPELVRSAEQVELDGVWFTETAHDPFLAVVLAAQHSSRIALGTAIALAFTRSPTLLAYVAWDLAALSGGRFILGLGTQVKAHIVRRFGMPWTPPAPRLRHTIQAVRAVIGAWRTGTPLDYRNDGMTLNLMTPFFTPPRHNHVIPIVTAGVNPPLCRVAGELADGFHVHPFHTPAYLHDVILPAIHRGRVRGGRTTPFDVVVHAFAVVEGDDAAIGATKRAIAFYASTPQYRGVLAHHGWEDLGPRLSALVRYGRWQEMGELIGDDTLNTFAVNARAEDLGVRLRERYAGLADRICIYEPFSPRKAALWRTLITACRS